MARCSNRRVGVCHIFSEEFFFLCDPILHDHGARTPHRLIYVPPIYCACATAWSSTSGGTCLRRACVRSRASSCGACCCASSCGSNAHSVNGTFCANHVPTGPGCSDVGGDDFEECMNLHEAWPQVQKWAADKKVCHMDCSSYSLFFPRPLVSEGALCDKIIFIWSRIDLVSWSWNDWNRIRVDTHISCPCVCGVRFPTWFLSLTSMLLIDFDCYFNVSHRDDVEWDTISLTADDGVYTRLMTRLFH